MEIFRNALIIVICCLFQTIFSMVTNKVFSPFFSSYIENNIIRTHDEIRVRLYFLWVKNETAFVAFIWTTKKTANFKKSVIWCQDTTVNPLSLCSENSLWNCTALFGSFSNMWRWKVSRILLSIFWKRYLHLFLVD